MGMVSKKTTGYPPDAETAVLQAHPDWGGNRVGEAGGWKRQPVESR